MKNKSRGHKKMGSLKLLHVQLCCDGLHEIGVLSLYQQSWYCCTLGHRAKKRKGNGLNGYQLFHPAFDGAIEFVFAMIFLVIIFWYNRIKHFASTMAHMYFAVKASPIPILFTSKKIFSLSPLGFAGQPTVHIHFHHPLSLRPGIADKYIIFLRTLRNARYKEFVRKPPW